MQNFDIKNYLAPYHIAKWAKDNGLHGECMGSYNKSAVLITGDNFAHDNLFLKKQWAEWVAAITFEQFFDWVEEKFNLIARVFFLPGSPRYLFFVTKRVLYKMDVNISEGENFENKILARIAACEAIIAHINSLPKS